MSKTKLSPVNQERLEIAHQLLCKALRDLKAKTLRGEELRRMKLVEDSVANLEIARLP